MSRPSTCSRLQRGGLGERRIADGRAQVGEQVEFLAQPEQAGLGPDRRRRTLSHFGPADGAEDDGVRGSALASVSSGERHAVLGRWRRRRPAPVSVLNCDLALLVEERDDPLHLAPSPPGRCRHLGSNRSEWAAMARSSLDELRGPLGRQLLARAGLRRNQVAPENPLLAQQFLSAVQFPRFLRHGERQCGVGTSFLRETSMRAILPLALSMMRFGPRPHGRTTRAIVGMARMPT